MTVAIVATDATLRTLHVTIKSLTVNGKQLTLAVFRQFPTISPIDDLYAIRRDLRFWGRVSYYIKDEGTNWAVAEYNGILYRGIVHRRPDEPYSPRDMAPYAPQRIPEYFDGWNTDLKDHIAHYEKQEAEKAKELREMLAYNALFPKLIKNLNESNAFIANLPQLFIAV